MSISSNAAESARNEFLTPTATKRREALLWPGARRRPAYEGGVADFAELDADRLEKLVAEGLADPAEHQNDGPTVAEVLAFLCATPEARAFGYAVSPERDDCRVTVDGVACKLRGLPEARRTELRAAFAAFASASVAAPDEYTSNSALIRLWWD